jgi:CBS domain-containing protein
VQKYSGIGIFAQGGVAIGLSIMASQHLGDFRVTDSISLGEMVVSSVTATTFLVQIIGPAMVKLAIRLAGENDRNVTEEDVMERMTVAQAATGPIESLRLTDRVATAVQRLSLGEFSACPVVGADQKLAGVLTLSQLKHILMDSDCWEWMLVEDVLMPGTDSIEESASLKKAMTLFEEAGIEQLAVVGADLTPKGILDVRQVRKVVQQERLSLLAAG